MREMASNLMAAESNIRQKRKKRLNRFYSSHECVRSLILN